MMARIISVLAILVLLSCNDKPDVQPASPLLNIFPNPASDFATFSVHSQNNQSFLLRVFDTKGKLLYEQTNSIDQIYTIEMTGRPTGTYEVIFSTGALVINQKLIKI